jgi:hypothetical protein
MLMVEGKGRPWLGNPKTCAFVELLIDPGGGQGSQGGVDKRNGGESRLRSA